MNTEVGNARLDCVRNIGSRKERRVPLPVQRTLDCLICLLAAPLALLVGAIIAFLIRLDGGPALYSQRRIGLGGRPFDCLKFRSMVPDAEARLQQLLASSPPARAEWDRFQKLGEDPRITRLGKLIRAFSLDELPQLANVWRGDMSIVGPRPIMADQIALYGESFQYYCLLRPGITGLWQIAGRNNCTFAERVNLDMEYARTWSVLNDLRIIVLTIPAVLARKGAR